MAKGAAAGFSERVTTAYATDGVAIELGRGIDGDDELQPGAVVQLPIAMTNRHGLVAGATGTGKTKTLQLMAEQLSLAGVPVFAGDVKGDLSGLTRPATIDDRIAKRVEQLGIEWHPTATPATYLALGGHGPGVPVRATVSSFGPQLLSKVLGLNDTQSSSLTLVFSYADQKELALVDLEDLRAVLTYLTSDDGKAELKSIGGLSSSTAGVLLRELTELEAQGAGDFFGEPEFDIDELLRVEDGRGVVSLLELAAVNDRPRLFSTFLMWLLAELWEQLPEVGDLDKPKLVFFFDEAHLLFDDAPEEFIDQVAQTVRLIRSKGVGVFFVTQLPDDVPDEVLAQLGNRIQHALRAFTPRDAKALKAAVTTYPNTDDYDLEEDLTRLGIGEAVVTTLNERGAPTPVVWTRLRPPQGSMAAVPPADVEAAAKDDALWDRYAEEIDPDSAAERLAEKMARGSAPDATVEGEHPPRPPAQPKGRKRKDENAVVGYLKSREGRQMMNTVARGVFGLLKKRR